MAMGMDDVQLLYDHHCEAYRKPDLLLIGPEPLKDAPERFAADNSLRIVRAAQLHERREQHVELLSISVVATVRAEPAEAPSVSCTAAYNLRDLVQLLMGERPRDYVIISLIRTPVVIGPPEDGD